jgi:MFS superfamily sulfate permease-like transporter
LRVLPLLERVLNRESGRGLPPIGLPEVTWNEASALGPVAASCLVMIIAQSAATSRAFALRYHERVDEDANILGLSVANAAAVTSTFVVNGSPTQTADLFFANASRFADQVRELVDCALSPVRGFIVDASAITDIDYSAAQCTRDLLDELARREVRIVFARVSPYLRSDMDRHHITAAVGEKWIFTTPHEAIAAVRDDAFGPHVK